MIRYCLPLLLILALSCADSKGKNSDLSSSDVNNSASQAELEYESAALLGEGAFWDYKNKRLFWVDIEGKKLHIYDPATKNNRSLPSPSRIGTVVPQTDSTAVVALEDGIYIMNLRDGSLALLSDIESDMKGNRFNDGKCDPNGNLWVGSMHLDESESVASLYRITSSGETTRMLEDITISNGIVWSSDHKKMYYIDTPTGLVRSFDYDMFSSEISNERSAIEIPARLGYPDGMAIDEEDMVWIALWNGRAVARFNPETGELLQKIDVPAQNVTSCAFGGDQLDILYITTASIGMTDEEKIKYPMAGSLFKVKPGVKGVKSTFFEKK